MLVSAIQCYTIAIQCKSAVSIYTYISFLLSLLIPIILSCIFTKDHLWLFQRFYPGFSCYSVQLLSRVWFFVTPWTAACQASLSISNSWSLLRLMSIGSMMPSNHLILCHPLFLLPSFPTSGSFQMSKLFTSGGQSIGVSASISVLPLNTQDWSPLGWTGWTSLQSKGLSRVSSNTTVQKHQFFCAQLSL